MNRITKMFGNITLAVCEWGKQQNKNILNYIKADDPIIDTQCDIISDDFQMETRSISYDPTVSCCVERVSRVDIGPSLSINEYTSPFVSPSHRLRSVDVHGVRYFVEPVRMLRNVLQNIKDAATRTEKGIFQILHIVLLAQLQNIRLHFPQIMPRHHWKQMVFHLVIITNKYRHYKQPSNDQHTVHIQ